MNRTFQSEKRWHEVADKHPCPKPPWYTLSSREGWTVISNTVGPDWASDDHFVAEVQESAALIIVSAVNEQFHRAERRRK